MASSAGFASSAGLASSAGFTASAAGSLAGATSPAGAISEDCLTAGSSTAGAGSFLPQAETLKPNAKNKEANKTDFFIIKKFP